MSPTAPRWRPCTSGPAAGAAPPAHRAGGRGPDGSSRRGDGRDPADPDDEGTTAPRGTGTASLTGAGLWVLLVGLAIWQGPDLLTGAAKVDAPPFKAEWSWGGSPALLAPALLAAGVVVAGPAAARAVRWRTLLAGSAAVTAAWSVGLAAVDGWGRVAQPMGSRYDYLAVLDRIGSPATFLDTYVERLGSHPVHVQGHPPGMALLLWAMDRAGLGGTGWAAALVLAGAAVGTAAALVTVRSVAGEAAARRAAPFVALAPAAVWLGTSADALFTGVIATGVALLVTGRRPVTWVAGGLVLGAALFMSYGAVPLLLLPAGVWAHRRDPVPLVWAAAGAALVAGAFHAGGFWWLDGLEATRTAYDQGVSASRPYLAFVALLNPAALAAVVGPAAVAGGAVLVLRRGRAPARAAAPAWLLPTLALAAVAAADLSGLSKGEVERIWLPFTPWLLAATAVLPRPRPWLAAQAAVGMALQVSLHASW